MEIVYDLTFSLPVSQVFIGKISLNDCIENALNETLSDGDIHFYDMRDEDGNKISRDLDRKLYTIYEFKGIQAFMRHTHYEIMSIKMHEGSHDYTIYYTIPIRIDMGGILDDYTEEE